MAMIDEATISVRATSGTFTTGQILSGQGVDGWHVIGIQGNRMTLAPPDGFVFYQPMKPALPMNRKQRREQRKSWGKGTVG